MGKALSKYIDKVSTKDAAPKKESALSKYIKDEDVNLETRNDPIIKDALQLGVHGASFGFSDELVGAISPNYEEGRDAHRKEIEGARERLPYVGPVIEAAGSAATTAVVPGLRAGHWVTELGLAGLQAVGENTQPERLAEDLAWSGGISLGANAVGGLLKKTVSPPEDILANSGGARAINYRKGEVYVGEDSAEEFADRLKDPAGIAARLDKVGFFGIGKKAFKNGQYVRDGGLLNGALEPVSLEALMHRVQSGVSHLGNANKQLLAGKKIPVQKLKATLDQAAMDFLPAGEDYVKRESMAQELSNNVFQDLVLSGQLKPGQTYLDAAVVEDVKRKWQKTVASSYDTGKAVSEITNMGVEARRKFSTALDKLVDSYGGPDYAKNNDMMRDLFAMETLIHNKSAMQRGYSGSGARLTSGQHLKESLLGNTIYHPQVDVARARIGQGLRTAPGQAAANALSRIPVEYNSSITTDQTPPVEVIENDPGHPMQQQKGRMPQSVPNIPEEFIRTPLPRTTKELMQKKNFVLGKVAQMMPEMFESVKEVMEHNPENLPELAQVLSQKMPHVFEKDKYNRFDGRIISEADKQKAIKDTLLRQDINPIEQAKIITKLNKEGLYDG